MRRVDGDAGQLKELVAGVVVRLWCLNRWAWCRCVPLCDPPVAWCEVDECDEEEWEDDEWEEEDE